jgi:nicotinamide riboside kinase
MKIAFIGTHGVGKTTLCFELAACLKRLDVGVDVVKEVARHCPLPINRDTTIDAQAWILHTQVAKELELSRLYEAVICDRSVLDNYAYMVHAAGRRPELEPFIKHWLDSYDLLVHVPVVTAPSFDGTRDTSVDFQLNIDQILREMVSEFGSTVHELDPNERDHWIRSVLKALDLPTATPQLDLFNTLGRQNES